jgi:hypothetical protein
MSTVGDTQVNGSGSKLPNGLKLRKTRIVEDKSQKDRLIL